MGAGARARPRRDPPRREAGQHSPRARHRPRDRDGLRHRARRRRHDVEQSRRDRRHAAVHEPRAIARRRRRRTQRSLLARRRRLLRAHRTTADRRRFVGGDSSLARRSWRRRRSRRCATGAAQVRCGHRPLSRDGRRRRWDSAEAFAVALRATTAGQRDRGADSIVRARSRSGGSEIATALDRVRGVCQLMVVARGGGLAGPRRLHAGLALAFVRVDVPRRVRRRPPDSPALRIAQLVVARAAAASDRGMAIRPCVPRCSPRRANIELDERPPDARGRMIAQVALAVRHRRFDRCSRTRLGIRASVPRFRWFGRDSDALRASCCSAAAAQQDSWWSRLLRGKFGSRPFPRRRDRTA